MYKCHTNYSDDRTLIILMLKQCTQPNKNVIRSHKDKPLDSNNRFRLKSVGMKVHTGNDRRLQLIHNL